MGRFQREFQPVFERVRASIFVLCGEFRFEPTHQQKAALQLVQDEADQPADSRLRRIAIKSGQGPGKTTVSVIVAVWRALRGIDAMVIVTAPTMRQCSQVWIAELRRLLGQAAPWLQKVLKVEKTKAVICNRPNWGILCVTATRPENMQGYHQKYLTFILDEASGIAREIWEQIKGTLGNPDSLLFAIGNPNVRDCAFFDCFNSKRSMWHTMTFNAEESPLVDPKNIRVLAEEFGRNSDVFRVRVLGEFPLSDPTCVMSQEDLEACTKTDMYACMREALDEKAIGMDFARFGSNESTIYRRVGFAVVDYKTFAKLDPGDLVSYAFRLQGESSWKDGECRYIVDAGGMGQGVLHRFYDADKLVHEFHTQGTAYDGQYANAMTEGWFTLAKLVKARRVHIPDDNLLIQQLSTRQYTTNKKGQLLLESKDEYGKRQENETDSPDRADGIVLCFYRNIFSESKMSVLFERQERA